MPPRSINQTAKITVVAVVIALFVALAIGVTLLAVVLSSQEQQQLFQCDSEKGACVLVTSDQTEQCGKTIDCYTKRSECKCWTCVPSNNAAGVDTEYPLSGQGGECAFSNRKSDEGDPPKFATEQECKLNEGVKCGWMYSCQADTESKPATSATAPPPSRLTTTTTVNEDQDAPLPSQDNYAFLNVAPVFDTPQFGHDPTTTTTAMCTHAPVSCDTGPGAPPSYCASMCGSDGWACQSVARHETQHGVEGTFCLPMKPTLSTASFPGSTLCSSEPVAPAQTADKMNGTLRWHGWNGGARGLDHQAWTCACPFPNYYPMDLVSGKCVRSSQVCAGGSWAYPCIWDGGGDGAPPRCGEQLTETEVSQLEGVAPSTHGMCTCPPGFRVASHPKLGVPQCVPDTCVVEPWCDTSSSCPGGATCVHNTCVASSSSCNEDEDCGPAGQCKSNGRCSWGMWRPLTTSPGGASNGNNTTGSGVCVCPPGATSIGSVCKRTVQV